MEPLRQKEYLASNLIPGLFRDYTQVDQNTCISLVIANTFEILWRITILVYLCTTSLVKFVVSK